MVLSLPFNGHMATEYQLILMKASDKGRNVKFQVIFWLRFNEFNSIVNFLPDCHV